MVKVTQRHDTPTSEPCYICNTHRLMAVGAGQNPVYDSDREIKGYHSLHCCQELEQGQEQRSC